MRPAIGPSKREASNETALRDCGWMLRRAARRPGTAADHDRAAPCRLRRGLNDIFPAAYINPSNVSRLALEWQWRPNEQRLADGNEPGNFSGTPLMIDDALGLVHVEPCCCAECGNRRSAMGVRSAAADPDGPVINLYYQHRGVGLAEERQRVAHLHEQPRPAVRGRREDGAVDHQFWPERLRDAEGGMQKSREQDSETVPQTSPPVVYRILARSSAAASRIVCRTRAIRRGPSRRSMRGPVNVSGCSTRLLPEIGNETWENDAWAITGHANVWER